MSRKPRILMVGESSYLATGFSTYGLEVTKRLHATGKYDLTELGCYGEYDDPRQFDLPWDFIPNLPDPSKPAEVEKYRSNKLYEFGAWKFEETCLAVRPDVVVDIRDWWMLEHEERSPFRRFYHWAIMPTVDAEPQDEQWLSTFANADSVHCYTDWGTEVLRRGSNGRIKCRGSAPPGADTDVLRPVQDKEAFKRSLGLPEGSLVVGTIMRNQRRKLYPDLLDTFARLLREAPAHLAGRVYLYLHTAHPDVGWDIPRLIKESGIGHRVLMTYVCNGCGESYPNFYSDVMSSCRHCKRNTAQLCHPSRGVSREVLGKVLNAMDVYVQYANSEGFGMPQVEAASCGVPVLAIDYSAMSDVVRKLGGVPLKVLQLAREAETHCNRAVPDNDDLLRQLVRVLSLPSPTRRAWGYRHREAVLEHYTYDRTASIWADLFDSVEIRPEQEGWGSPARTHVPNMKPPANLTNEDWVRWCICHVAGRPDLCDSFMSLRMIRDLNWTVTSGGMGGLAFNDASAIGLGLDKKTLTYTRNDAAKQLLDICEQQNYWELRRTARG